MQPIKTTISVKELNIYYEYLNLNTVNVKKSVRSVEVVVKHCM